MPGWCWSLRSGWAYFLPSVEEAHQGTDHHPNDRMWCSDLAVLARVLERGSLGFDWWTSKN